MSDVAVIYTEITKESDPIGGIWSAAPFAFRHVAWVPADEFDAAMATISQILSAAERGDFDEVKYLAARALAHLCPPPASLATLPQSGGPAQ